MPPIKNYTKVRSGDRGKRVPGSREEYMYDKWVNTKSSTEVWVGKISEDYSNGFQWFYQTSSGDGAYRGVDSHDDARKRAVSWMRSHPNG